MPNDTDPICGMKGTIPRHGHKFCSDKCIAAYEKQHGLDQSVSDSKLPAIILVSILVAGLAVSIFIRPFMTYFMGAVLGILAVLKLLDLRGFADAYRMYDLITKKVRMYGFIYPFIELALAAAFLLNAALVPAAIILIFFMAEGLLSVGLELKAGRKVRCACMGTKINVPLTTLTIAENTIMIIMALMLLL